MTASMWRRPLADVTHMLRHAVHAPSRERRHQSFMRLARPLASETVLDVGATDSADYSANYLERTYPWPARITAVGIEPLTSFATHFPEVQALSYDGKTLPFPDRSFDIVYSNAVLEHVGDADAQRRFLAEAARVCRRFLYVTTPNRAFPVDSHTLVPFAHWLPKSRCDAIYGWLGVGAWLDGRLRLVTRRELLRLAGSAGWPPCGVVTQRLLGMTSVLLLYADRGRPADTASRRACGSRDRNVSAV